VFAAPSIPKPVSREEELGQVLFKRGQNAIVVFVMIVASLFFLGITLFAVAESIRNRSPEALVFSTVFVCLAAAVMLYVFVRSSGVLRCHEFGVSVSGWLSQRGLRFDRAAAFTFRTVQVNFHGIPLGTTFRLCLEPESGAGRKPIVFSGSLRKNDPEMDMLRDLASRAVAQRMGRELIAGGRVAWTRQLDLLAQGIEHRSLGLFGRKPPAVLPYEQIARIDIRDGFFSVWRRGRKRAAISGSSSQANFFPGHRLLLTILEQKRKIAAGGEDA